MYKEFTASTDSEKTRVDVFIASIYSAFTRSALEALFEQKLVFINQKPAKASQKLKDGDVVSVDESLLKLAPPAIDLPVVYEDGDVMVINKPAGVLTHSKGALNLEGTVASFINPKLFPVFPGCHPGNNRAGIVHRLDRATSGVIITAKNAEALSKLQKQFSKRKAKKTYIAVVEGVPEPEAAIIDAPMARNPAKPQTFKVTASGKSAITEYRTIKAFKKGKATFSLVELKPQTGRTHQLRVHLAYVGHPIVGDRVYGHAGEHLLLHAQSLEITLPDSQRKTFKAPIPKYIKDFADV